MLSGYRLMWIAVLFDLPVVEKAARKAAANFRNTLLDMGFEMAQFSVYLRFCSTQAQIDTLLQAGGKHLAGRRQSQYPGFYRQTIRAHHLL